MTTLNAQPATSSVVPINRIFVPATFIGKGWGLWRGPADGNGLQGDLEQDNLSIVLPEVDTSKILLETLLKPDESYTTGEERIARLIAANRIRFNLNMFQTFWDDKRLMPPSFSERVNGEFKFIFVDGETLRSPRGERATLAFFRGVLGRWGWQMEMLYKYRGVNGPSAVLAQ